MKRPAISCNEVTLYIDVYTYVYTRAAGGNCGGGGDVDDDRGDIREVELLLPLSAVLTSYDKCHQFIQVSAQQAISTAHFSIRTRLISAFEIK